MIQMFRRPVTICQMPLMMHVNPKTMIRPNNPKMRTACSGVPVNLELAEVGDNMLGATASVMAPIITTRRRPRKINNQPRRRIPRAFVVQLPHSVHLTTALVRAQLHFGQVSSSFNFVSQALVQIGLKTCARDCQFKGEHVNT